MAKEKAIRVDPLRRDPWVEREQIIATKKAAAAMDRRKAYALRQRRTAYVEQHVAIRHSGGLEMQRMFETDVLRTLSQRSSVNRFFISVLPSENGLKEAGTFRNFAGLESLLRMRMASHLLGDLCRSKLARLYHDRPAGRQPS